MIVRMRRAFADLSHRALAGLVLIASAAGAEPARAGEPSLRAGVVFGTTCARCHEGQCSGRLTFDARAEVAAGHVRRHAGAVTDEEIRQLFALLETMKTTCSYPPLPIATPEDGRWSVEMLDRLRAPSRRQYVVPLGALEPGRYTAVLSIAGPAHVHAEVVTHDFETLVEEPLEIDPGHARASLSFTSPSRTALRLRLYSRDEIRIDALELDPVDGR